MSQHQDHYLLSRIWVLLPASYQDGHLPVKPNKLLSNVRNTKPNMNTELALLWPGWFRKMTYAVKKAVAVGGHSCCH